MVKKVDEKSVPDGAGSDSDDRSAIAKALDLAYALMSICAMMALPALGGFYLDRWLGTWLLFTVVGFVFGLATSVFQFLRMLKRIEGNDPQRPGGRNGQGKGE